MFAVLEMDCQREQVKRNPKTQPHRLSMQKSLSKTVASARCQGSDFDKEALFQQLSFSLDYPHLSPQVFVLKYPLESR